MAKVTYSLMKQFAIKLDVDYDCIHDDKTKQEILKMFQDDPGRFIELSAFTPEVEKVELTEKEQEKISRLVKTELEHHLVMRSIRDRLDIQRVVLSLDQSEMLKVIDNAPFYKGRHRFAYECGNDFATAVYPSSTYWDVFKDADRALLECNEDHHIYLEQIIDIGEDANGVRVFKFDFGS